MESKKKEKGKKKEGKREKEGERHIPSPSGAFAACLREIRRGKHTGRKRKEGRKEGRKEPSPASGHGRERDGA